MNSMLKTILDIDRQAQQKVAEAEEYRNNAIAELNNKKNGIIEKEMKKAKDSAQRRSQRMKAGNEKNLSEIREHNAAVLENLEALYSQNADKWVDEIVLNVTK